VSKSICACVVLSLWVTAAWADALGDAKEGLAAQKRGDYPSARYFFVRAIQGGSTLSAADLELAYVKLAEVDLQLGNRDAALGEVQNALKINPSDPEAVHVMTTMQQPVADQILKLRCTLQELPTTDLNRGEIENNGGVPPVNDWDFVINLSKRTLTGVYPGVTDTVLVSESLITWTHLISDGSPDYWVIDRITGAITMSEGMVMAHKGSCQPQKAVF
jgi:tetratricopeptide (TPR) repeat protein